MGMRLNEIIEAALRDGTPGARVKVAAATETCECGKPCAEGSKYCKECADKKSQAEAKSSGAAEEPEKTSSARVTKLANAVAHIVANFGDIQMPIGRIKAAAEETGPGIGPGSLEVSPNMEMDKAPDRNFGQAKVQVPLNPASEVGAGKNTAPNAVKTDASGQPGLNATPTSAGATTQPGTIPGLKAPSKTASLVEQIKAAMLKKAADGPDASISAGKETTLPENQSASGGRPAEVTSQERLIGSNQAAIDVTPRQAAEVPKKRMGELLTEPMQSASTDKTLNAALGSKVVTDAGAKIASARAELQKTASAGCQCGGKHTCGFCKIASQLERRQGAQAGELWAAGRTPGSARSE